MFTIKENRKYILEIKKSKFICLMYKVDNINDIDKYLKDVKDEYKDATHYCYAYKLMEKIKFSDDGEPGGTAGLPIMEVLNKNNLVNVLCIVVRYFGGIKLGAGGLVRAYTKVVSKTLEENVIVELIKGYLVSLTTDYNKQKELDNILKNTYYKKEFNNKVKYTIKCDSNILDIIKNLNINYDIEDEILIEKY